MDTDDILFWILIVMVASGLIRSFRIVSAAGPAMLIIHLGILAVVLTSRELNLPFLLYVAIALWLLFVLAPGLVARRYSQYMLEHRYVAARRVARLLSILHPTPLWLKQPRIVHAYELAHLGDLDAAEKILLPFQNDQTAHGLSVTLFLFRMRDRWEEALAWQVQHAAVLGRQPLLLPLLLRARGEAGDLRGLIEMYEGNRQLIAKLPAGTSRDSCRLMLFAFCGKKEAAERLLQGPIGKLPQGYRDFWIATAELAAGDTDVARTQFESLVSDSDAQIRLGSRRRLAVPPASPVQLDAATERLIDEESRTQQHEQTFGAQPSFFSKRARVTQILIGLNLLMFLAEILAGGSTDSGVLYRLGAMSPAAVSHGEWWRLLASTFLHLGWLHVTMNMAALLVLGPFIELALGWWRFAALYLVAGIGSMAAVALLTQAPEAIAVGASGSIMGLVGALGALMLRGWTSVGALSAKRRLLGVVCIILSQTIFDAIIPQVSMTAHLSGAVIGFALAAFLRHRLKPPPLPSAARPA